MKAGLLLESFQEGAWGISVGEGVWSYHGSMECG